MEPQQWSDERDSPNGSARNSCETVPTDFTRALELLRVVRGDEAQGSGRLPTRNQRGPYILPLCNQAQRGHFHFWFCPVTSSLFRSYFHNEVSCWKIHCHRPFGYPALCYHHCPALSILIFDVGRLRVTDQRLLQELGARLSAADEGPARGGRPLQPEGSSLCAWIRGGCPGRVLLRLLCLGAPLWS